MDRSPALTIDVWSDVVCPWCYVGEERLRRALDAEDLTERTQIVLHSFELAPDAPEIPQTVTEYFTERKGLGPEQALEMETNIRQLAADLDLAYVLDRPMARTRATHRLVQAARAAGKDAELFRRVQHGYFSGTLDPFDEEQLVSAAVAVGLPEEDMRSALTEERTLTAVLKDQEIAQQLGVRGVPFVLIGRRLAVPGAVDVDQFRQALRQGLEMEVPGDE